MGKKSEWTNHLRIQVIVTPPLSMSISLRKPFLFPYYIFIYSLKTQRLNCSSTFFLWIFSWQYNTAPMEPTKALILPFLFLFFVINNIHPSAQNPSPSTISRDRHQSSPTITQTQSSESFSRQAQCFHCFTITVGSTGNLTNWLTN